MTIAERLQKYLDATGWEKATLARRAGIHPSTITRMLHGRKTEGLAEEYEIGELVAIKLERATMDAYSRGETSVPPLRMSDMLAPDAQRPTGTG